MQLQFIILFNSFLNFTLFKVFSTFCSILHAALRYLHMGTFWANAHAFVKVYRMEQME